MKYRFFIVWGIGVVFWIMYSWCYLCRIDVLVIFIPKIGRLTIWPDTFLYLFIVFNLLSAIMPRHKKETYDGFLNDEE
jgi:hypothetical protein